MEICVGGMSIYDELCPVNVELREKVDQYGATVDVRVWIPNVDSRAEAYASAKVAALGHLKSAVAALEAELEAGQ